MVLTHSFRTIIILVLLNMMLHGLQQPLSSRILQLVLDGDHSLNWAHLELLGHQATLIELNYSLIVLLNNLLDEILGQLHFIL